MDERERDHVVDVVAARIPSRVSASPKSNRQHTHSRSAKFASGPFLLMMRMAASCVRIRTLLMSAALLPSCRSLAWRMCAASTAVCAWNSAGYEILKSTFSMM